MMTWLLFRNAVHLSILITITIIYAVVILLMPTLETEKIFKSTCHLYIHAPTLYIHPIILY